MGDISEYRGIIVIFTFIGVFALLVTSPFFPVGFVMPATNMTIPNTPSSVWQASTMQFGSYNETWEYRFNNTLGFEVDVNVYAVLDVGSGSPEKFGGHDIDLWYTDPNQTTYSKQWIIFRHNYGFLSTDEMNWYASDGTDLTYGIVNPAIHSGFLVEDIDNYDLPLKVQCDHFYMSCDFYYNQTVYANTVAAFNHNDLYLLIGINFDQMGASFDSFSLISRLVTFQPVDVPFPINIIMALGIWAAVGYIVFIIVLRVIGSVFGGGGA